MNNIDKNNPNVPENDQNWIETDDKIKALLCNPKLYVTFTSTFFNLHIYMLQ